MGDLMMIAFTIIFFIVAVWYVKACERLR